MLEILTRDKWRELDFQAWCNMGRQDQECGLGFGAGDGVSNLGN